jgi:uncharacterized membrane protein HdeD (DUF308 family)
MADHNEIDTHPVWEDGLSFGLGVLIVLTPYLTGDAVSQTVQVATTFLGLLVMFAAFTERLQVIDRAVEPAREWEEVLEVILGAAMIALPFLFGYANAGTLRYWHFALGAVLLLLAIFQLRRDYVGELQRHGWWRHM